MGKHPIRIVSPEEYLIPMTGGPFHKNIEWYATQDEVLGVVILDLVDKDYSWVVLNVGPTVGYGACDLGTDCQTVGEARKKLHAAMLKAEPMASASDEWEDDKLKPIEIERVEAIIEGGASWKK